MRKKILKFSSHTVLVCVEIAAVLVGLIVLAGGLFVWRLMAGPFDVNFARNYIEESLSDPGGSYTVTMESIHMNWPDLRGPVMLELRGIDLVKQGRTVLEIGVAGVGLSAGHLLLGGIEPVSIALTSPAVHVIRTVDGAIRLNVEGEKEEPVSDEESSLENILKTIAGRSDGVAASSPVANLESFDIKDARVVVEDHLLGISWFVPHLDVLFARDAQGLVASASLDLPGGYNDAGRLQTDMIYYRDSGELKAKLHLQDFDPHTLSRKIEALGWLNDHDVVLNGDAEVTVGPGFNLKTLDIDVVSQDGVLALEGVYDKPLPYQQLLLYASYDHAQKTLNVHNVSAAIGGVEVAATVAATLGDDAITADVTLKVPELRPETLKPLWPDVLRGDGAEIWLTQKMSAGRIYDAQAGFRLDARRDGQASDDWSASVEGIAATFAIEGMDVDYRAPLPPARALTGKGKYENDTISIDVESAKVEALDVKSGHVLLEKVSSAKEGRAAIKMNLEGELPAVFRYIAEEPIELSAAEIGIDHRTVKGSAAFSADVAFPLVKDLRTEEVIVAIDGTFKDVYLPKVVKTLDLSGATLAVSVKDGAVGMKGRGKLDGRDVTLDLTQYLSSEGKPFSMRVVADVVADKALRDVFGAGLEDWIDGTTPLSVIYSEYADGRADAQIRADLQPARLMLKPFGYEKPAGEPARVSCLAVLKGGDIAEVKAMDLDAPNLTIRNASFAFDAGSVLRRGLVPKIKVGETDAGIELESIEKERRLKILMTGPVFDARPFLARKKDQGQTPYDGPQVEASVVTDRMLTHKDRDVGKAKLYLALGLDGGVDQLEMDAVAGRGAIYMRLKPAPDTGRMTLRLEADDAGAALRAFGVYENVQGGKLAVNGQSKTPDTKKIVYGTGQLVDFRVVDAPVLARLVSAISLVGIAELLGGEGIYFSKLESDFEWRMRPRGDLYIFRDGRTSGSSLGLTFEGEIDKAANLTDISGTIIPVSMINELISNIPLIGDILTGGEGGAVIAATYTVKGPSENPTTSVNPLAALAPGILRRILFEEN